MEKSQNITICMGSSCFSRGNKKLVRMIQDFLKENRLEDEVLLKGAHCLNHCDKGPIMQINADTVYHVTEENLIETLQEKLGLNPE